MPDASSDAVPNLRLSLLTLAVAYFVYRYCTSYLSYKVGCCEPLAKAILLTWNEIQRETEWGARHGCQPMGERIPYRWPLALDLLKEQYDANKDKHLFASQTKYFDKYGPNFAFTLLGNQGLLTFDPKNVEAILVTHFEGAYCSIGCGLPKMGVSSLMVTNPCRLPTRSSKRCSLLLPWRRHLHPRWRPVEAFSRAPQTPF